MLPYGTPKRHFSVHFAFRLLTKSRSQEQSPDAIKERVGQLEPELRRQVQARSYGARRNLIEAPLRELELDTTPRVGTRPTPSRACARLREDRG